LTDPSILVVEKDQPHNNGAGVPDGWTVKVRNTSDIVAGMDSKYMTDVVCAKKV